LSTALSYARVAGANDRISLAHIGIGNRGTELDWIVSTLKDSHNVELTAVCDLWSRNRERAIATNEKYYGRPPRALAHPEDLLALKDVDGVLISTPSIRIPGPENDSGSQQARLRREAYGQRSGRSEGSAR
jgi:hypothetical protein